MLLFFLLSAPFLIFAFFAAIAHGGLSSLQFKRSCDYFFGNGTA